MISGCELAQNRLQTDPRTRRQAQSAAEGLVHARRRGSSRTSAIRPEDPGLLVSALRRAMKVTFHPPLPVSDVTPFSSSWPSAASLCSLAPPHMNSQDGRVLPPPPPVCDYLRRKTSMPAGCESCVPNRVASGCILQWKA